MLSFWRPRLAAAMGGRAEVREAPLEEALRHLRTAVPALEVVNAGTPDAILRWSTTSVDVSDALDTCFWEFMALADAPDEEIVRFAQRFGPLVYPAARQSKTAPRLSAPNRPDESKTEFTEPLAAWRMYARGLHALYDLVDPAYPVKLRDGGMWIRAMAAIAIPLWLEDMSQSAPLLTEDELAPLAASLAINRELFSPDWLVTSALDLAGVGPAFRSQRQIATGLTYTLPAEAFAAAGRHLWQVQGLLPVLTVSLAVAAQTQERIRCTRCGKPAAILKRRPRKDRPWYGDHDGCRALARADTMNRAEDKRAEKRKSRSKRDLDAGHAEPSEPSD